MAIGTISLPQRPIESAAKVPVITNWTPVVPYTVKQTDITDLFYFKFIFEIRINGSTGTLLAKIKQRPNGYTTGTTDVYSVFNIRDIINTQLENTYADQNDTTKSIHTLGSNVTANIFSENYNQVKYIYIKAYQEYSAAADISPTENATENAPNQKYYIKASLPLETARTSGTYFQGTAFQIFQTKDVNGRFLSDVQQSTGDIVSSSVYRNYVQWDDSTNTGDFHTVAFLNSESDFDSTILNIAILYYDSDGSQIGTYKIFTNNDTNGGAIPSTSGGEVTNNAERLIYFGCGPGNLEAQSVNTDARPSNFSGWAYYTIQGLEGVAGRTAPYYFIRQDASCKGFKIRRLGWLNSVGCWDYFNFKMKSKQSVDVKRNTYGQMLGEFNSTEYSYNNFDATRKVRSTTAILKETLNTDWITEQDAELLEKCVMSTDVFIIENIDTTYTVPVMITNKSISRKTQANDGIKIRYTINIEYANPLNTNS
jgi:hypothetical protein